MTFREEILADGVRLICGDCREVLPTLGKVDAVVTDQPETARYVHRTAQAPKATGPAVTLSPGIIAIVAKPFKFVLNRPHWCAVHDISFEHVPRRKISGLSYPPIWRCPRCVAEAKERLALLKAAS